MKKDKKYYRDSLRELKPYDPHEVPYKIKLNENKIKCQ
jgi:histidinol-phosphate aminotransferase